MLKKKIKVMWACLSIGVLLAGCGKTGVKLVDEYCDWDMLECCQPRHLLS